MSTQLQLIAVFLVQIFASVPSLCFGLVVLKLSVITSGPVYSVSLGLCPLNPEQPV